MALNRESAATAMKSTLFTCLLRAQEPHPAQHKRHGGDRQKGGLTGDEHRSDDGLHHGAVRTRDENQGETCCRGAEQHHAGDAVLGLLLEDP